MITTEQRIVAKCNEISDFLIDKNAQYGDAYSCGVKVFSQISSQERIRARIDEKLNRTASGVNNTEDTEKDLVGLLIHLLIQRDISEGK